jgi:hypothetical protein
MMPDATLDAAFGDVDGALALAERLDMRPLAARCRSLAATLHGRNGDVEAEADQRAAAARAFAALEMDPDSIVPAIRPS